MSKENNSVDRESKHLNQKGIEITPEQLGDVAGGMICPVTFKCKNCGDYIQYYPCRKCGATD